MKDQIKAGVILSYLQMVLGIIVGLLYTPLMIKVLGQSEYGLYNTVASTISLLSILSLGFNAGYIRFYSKYVAQNDKNSINSLNGMFLELFLIIGIVALLSGLYLSNHLRIVFKNGLSDVEYRKAKTLFQLLTYSLAISFPMSVFSTIISAHEKFVFLKALGMIKTVLSPLLTIPVLLLGKGSVGMVITTITVSLMVDVLYFYYCVAKLKCRFSFRIIDKSLFRNLAIYTSFIAINIVIDQINWNVDKVLLARFKGTSVVAIYTVGYTLYSYYQQLSTSISSLFTPKIHAIENSNLKSAEKNTQLTGLMIKVGRVQLLLLGLVISGIILTGKYFITSIWAGSEYEESFYVSLLLIIPATIALIQNVGIEIQRAKNQHQFRSIAYSVMALLNISLSIYLCQLYGAIGSAIGTAISLIIANGLVMNVYYYKHCGIDVLRFWKEMISLLISIVITCGIGKVFFAFFIIDSISHFVIAVLFVTFMYIVLVWLIGINKAEKQMVKHFFISFRNRL